MKKVTASALALAGGLVLLTGCASASSGGTGPGASGGPGSGAGTGATSLTVRVDPGYGEDPKIWTLTCDPPAGTHPQASAACAQLAAIKGDPFAETPKDTACTMIYGGDQKAQITGTYQGRHVDTKVTRTDGCQVARWERLSAVLVFKGGVKALT
jgi:hypothetical protein